MVDKRLLAPSHNDTVDYNTQPCFEVALSVAAATPRSFARNDQMNRPLWLSIIRTTLFLWLVPMLAASVVQRMLARSYRFAADHPLFTFIWLTIVGVILWLAAFALYSRRRHGRYQVGQTISRFIARDVRRDVEILDICRLQEGFVTARVRTMNILYVTKGLVQEPDFEPAREIAVVDLWTWTGQSWGGLPDSTSLVGTHLHDQHNP